MKYAITAATGNFGKYAVSELTDLVGLDNVVAIARNTDKAKKVLPSGIEVREGNYDDKDSMVAALTDIDSVLFISSQPGGEVSRLQQHKNVVAALVESNVSFVAYTSFPNAKESSSFLAEDHKNTEIEIENSGIAHAFLRNNWYLENEEMFINNGASNGKADYWADNKAGWALEREYAEAAAKSLVSQRTKEVYELSGSLNSYEELGKALKLSTNSDIDIVKVSADEYTSELEKAGLPRETAEMVSSFQAPIDDGSLNIDSGDLSALLGRNPLKLSEAIKEILERK